MKLSRGYEHNMKQISGVVDLVDVTKDNYLQVVELCVSPEQERFVGTPAEAIADAHFHPSYQILAIRERTSRAIVGFLMFECQNDAILHRFLIDCKHQGRGYGKSALHQFMELLRWFYPDRNFSVSLKTKATNVDAIRVYEKTGFVLSADPNDETVVVGTLRGQNEEMNAL